jgi:hypothetical protein
MSCTFPELITRLEVSELWGTTTGRPRSRSEGYIWVTSTTI